MLVQFVVRVRVGEIVGMVAGFGDDWGRSTCEVAVIELGLDGHGYFSIPNILSISNC